MKTTKPIVALLMVLAVLVFTPAAFAQTTVVQTTLAAAVTDTAATLIQLASTTSVTAATTSLAQYCYVDQELLYVRAIPASGFIQVRRGEGATVGGLHQNAAVVTCGPAGNFIATTGVSSGVFVRIIPQAGTTCVVANQAFTFVLDATSGTYARCNASSTRWEVASTKAIATKKPSVDAGNANYTATLFDYHIHYGPTAATTTRTVTLPSVTNDFGTELIISEFTTGGTSPTITISGANSQLIGGATTASLTTNGGSVHLISVGGAWRTLQ